MIRRFERDDHQALMRFLTRVFEQLGRRFVPDGKDADIRDIEAAYLGNRACFHVVDHDEDIRGCVGVRPFTAEAAELKRFYVEQAWRGRGFGRELLRAAIEDARRMGYRALRLDTTHESAAALRLFRAAGFEEIPRSTTTLTRNYLWSFGSTPANVLSGPTETSDPRRDRIRPNWVVDV